MATVSISSSPITQVSQHVPTHASLQPQLLTRLFLDLRGRRFEVDRETIMNLPESVLLCLFPNGLVLSRQSVALADGGENEEDEEVYGVDVSTRCSIILFVFRWRVLAYAFFVVLFWLCSSTQNVSNTCLRSLGMPLRHSTVPLLRQASSVHNSISSTGRRPLTFRPRRRRIPSSQSRL